MTPVPRPVRALQAACALIAQTCLIAGASADEAANRTDFRFAQGPATSALSDGRSQPPSPVKPLDENSRTVMREDLAPVMASDGSGLPFELWRGLSIADIEGLLANLEIPPRSPALHALFLRLITTDVPPPAGAAIDARFTAVRVEALDRSGLLDDALRLLRRDPAANSDPVLIALTARTLIARAERQEGCEMAQRLPAMYPALPEALRRSSMLMVAYCTAAQANREAAQLQAALARENGLEQSPGLDALEAIGSDGGSPPLDGQKIDHLDWRILELGRTPATRAIVEGASPVVLALIARDMRSDLSDRILAAEKGARLNAIPHHELAQIYLSVPSGGLSEQKDDMLARAVLFQGAQKERTQFRKTRLIRSFLDEMRRHGLYWQALKIVADETRRIQRVPEIGWFAETAIEVAIADGDFASAREWATFGAAQDQPGGLSTDSFAHWRALADIADPQAKDGRATHLDAVTALAARGRYDPDHLHRLATVLDALDIQVPIPLWELASRTPQPATGHLPETGVLAQLADAANKQEFGRTVLLAMQSLGPAGAEGAHMIALADAIRALRRAGLESDARQLGLEALFAGWPRTAGR